MKTKLKIPEALVKTAEPAVELEPISTELEQASDMLLDSVLQTKDHMQTYYDTLLNAENPEITDIEVRQKLDSYKRAAGNIKKAHLVTSDITDELSALMKANGKDTSLVDAINSAYANEKELKKAYYISLYK